MKPESYYEELHDDWSKSQEERDAVMARGKESPRQMVIYKRVVGRRSLKLRQRSTGMTRGRERQRLIEAGKRRAIGVKYAQTEEEYDACIVSALDRTKRQKNLYNNIKKRMRKESDASKEVNLEKLSQPARLKQVLQALAKAERKAREARKAKRCLFTERGDGHMVSDKPHETYTPREWGNNITDYKPI